MREQDTGGGWDASLVGITGPDGGRTATGFAVDDRGTVITSRDALARGTGLLLSAASGRTRAIGAEDTTVLPHGLVLLHAPGLGLRPLPVTSRHRIPVGTAVRIAADGWRDARVLGTQGPALPARAGRCGLGTGCGPGGCRRPTGACTGGWSAPAAPPSGTRALWLAVGTRGRDALRPGGGACGGPVLDAATGAVLAVLTTAPGPAAHDPALPPEHGPSGVAVPLRSAADGRDPLAAVLARNGAEVPALGADLNLAGVLRLAATTTEAPVSALPRPRVERPATAAVLDAFLDGDGDGDGDGDSDGVVLALVGAPGTGRTTEAAALAGRRGRDGLPTFWLRGADLRAADDCVAPAVARVLARAGQPAPGSGPAPDPVAPEDAARVAREAGRAPLVVLDAPEEMPPELLRDLPGWTGRTTDWLCAAGVRLVVVCTPEYWEGAGRHVPDDLLYVPYGAPAYPGALPCAVLGAFDGLGGRRLRAAHGVPEGALAERDARHPLVLRLLAEVRAALPHPAPGGRPDRGEVFAAHLDLVALRIARRLAASQDPAAVRRLATCVCGRLHEAARRCLGTARGALDRPAFDELFPRQGGWARAVLAEGALVAAGDGYRFAHEEQAEWLQGHHVDLDAVLAALAHARGGAPGSRRSPAPRHRVRPLVQALLHRGGREGSARLAGSLRALLAVADRWGARAVGDRADGHADTGADTVAGAGFVGRDAEEAHWWATRLLAGTLGALPDAAAYVGVLRQLAEHIVGWRAEGRPVPAVLGPGFWATLELPVAQRLDLLRRLVVTDGSGGGERHLDAAAALLAADPPTAQRHLVLWFSDDRPLAAAPAGTVARAAGALLHADRHRSADTLTEALADSGHPRAGHLLMMLAAEEPAVLCRAVDRWAHDERPARSTTAARYAAAVAPYARSAADRSLLRCAAATLLARSTDDPVRGAALGVLVGDPASRPEHLGEAVRRFTEGLPGPSASALGSALPSHPAAVLAAFRARLLPVPGSLMGGGKDGLPPIGGRAARGSVTASEEDGGAAAEGRTDRTGAEAAPVRQEAGRAGRGRGPGGRAAATVLVGSRPRTPAPTEAVGLPVLSDGDDDLLLALAEAARAAPSLASRVTGLVRDVLGERPDIAGAVTRYLVRRLADPAATRAELEGLITGTSAAPVPAAAPVPSAGSAASADPSPSVAPAPAARQEPAAGQAPAAGQEHAVDGEALPGQEPVLSPESSAGRAPAPSPEPVLASAPAPSPGPAPAPEPAHGPGLGPVQERPRREEPAPGEPVPPGRAPAPGRPPAPGQPQALGQCVPPHQPLAPGEPVPPGRPAAPGEPAPPDPAPATAPSPPPAAHGDPAPHRVARAVLAGALTACRRGRSGELGDALLHTLLDTERDPLVLDAVLAGTLADADRRSAQRTRALLHRTGSLLARTPDGAARLDRRLAEHASGDPAFAALLAAWAGDAPDAWAPLVGPGTREVLDRPATTPVPA